MNKRYIFNTFSNLIVWRNTGKRAPHKPLLVLYALAEWARGKYSIRYEDARKPLIELLRYFGNPNGKQRPEYPFWRLQNDSVWEVHTALPISLGRDNAAGNKDLLKLDAVGRFTGEIREAFIAQPTLIPALARHLLQAHFPESLHNDILDTIGLDLAPPDRANKPRDANFRKLVLTAYRHRCAVCGLHALLSGNPVAIEAAHIKWHQAGGPAIISNGLALCVIHHKLFDLGGFTLGPDREVLVSDEVGDSDSAKDQLLRFNGKKLLNPTHPEDELQKTVYYVAYKRGVPWKAGAAPRWAVVGATRTRRLRLTSSLRVEQSELAV